MRYARKKVRSSQEGCSPPGGTSNHIGFRVKDFSKIAAIVAIANKIRSNIDFIQLSEFFTDFEKRNEKIEDLRGREVQASLRDAMLCLTRPRR